MYRDGNLVSGSLEALVQHMVPTEEYYPDRAYLFAFLLSARLFIKPHELLGEVCALCEHQQNLNGEGGKVSISILPTCKMTRSLLLTSRIHEGYLLLFHRKVMCILVWSYFPPLPSLVLRPIGKYKHKNFRKSLISLFLLLYYSSTTLHSNEIDRFCSYC